jgi:hypothetical protein
MIIYVFIFQLAKIGACICICMNFQLIEQTTCTVIQFLSQLRFLSFACSENGSISGDCCMITSNQLNCMVGSMFKFFFPVAVAVCVYLVGSFESHIVEHDAVSFLHDVSPISVSQLMSSESAAIPDVRL